jgi:transcriptional regulator with XRE-family HTH domain
VQGLACAQHWHTPRVRSRVSPRLLPNVARLPYLGHMTDTATSPPGGVPEWTLGDRLRKARVHRGLEQEQLAELIGLKRSTIGNYERGDTPPKRPVLLAWSVATGVPLKWIETGKPPPGPNGPDGGIPSDDDGGGLPRLDLNQEPAGYRSRLLNRWRPLRPVTIAA